MDLPPPDEPIDISKDGWTTSTLFTKLFVMLGIAEGSELLIASLKVSNIAVTKIRIFWLKPKTYSSSLRKVEVKGGKKSIPIRATAPALTTKPSPNRIKNITGGAPSFMNTVGAGGPRIYRLLSKGQIISKPFFGGFDFLQKTNENKSTWGITEFFR